MKAKHLEGKFKCMIHRVTFKNREEQIDHNDIYHRDGKSVYLIYPWRPRFGKYVLVKKK